MNTLVKVLGEKYPAYRPQIESASTVASKLVRDLDAVSPAMVKAGDVAQRVHEKARELNVYEYAPLLLGLALCFFGGSFAMLVAVVETVRLVCWEDIRSSYAILEDNYDVAAVQSKRDDLIDADGNGIADVLELQTRELLSRKIHIFVKSVNMVEVRAAGRTLMAAFFSVIAALRVRTARSLALAGSLVKTARESIALEKALCEGVTEDQRKWSALISGCVFSGISVLLSLVLRSYEGYIDSAIRGASMFVRDAIRIASEKGLIETGTTMESPQAKMLMGVVAAMGFLWQMTNKDGLPFPINLILFPLTFVEWMLQAIITYCL